MNFSIQNVIASLRSMWQKLSKGQRMVTVIIPVVLLTSILTLVWWAGRPDYTSLFQGALSPTDAAAVTTKLKDLKIPYQLSDGGATILVPKAQIDEARLDLASAGVPQGSKFSFDYLNNTMQFGETDADRKVQYDLALQSELAATLKTLAPIEDATVNLAIPDQSLFTDQQQSPTAAVTVKLTPGSTLSDEQVRGIANLLAASVDGLKPQNITIVDTNGQLLSQVLNNTDGAALTGSQLQMQQAVEQNLQNAAQTMLDQAFGPGQSVIRVAATLNFDQVQINKDTYGNNVLLSKQDNEELSVNGTGTGGLTGTISNVPGYQATSTQTITGTVNDKKSDTTDNYDVDKTSEQRVVSPGSIQQLSVSVLVNAKTANPQTIQAIKNLVTNAVGINPQRGDQIQVVAMPFNNQYLVTQQQAMLKQEQTQRYLQYGIAGAVVVLGLLLGLTWLIRRKRKAQHQAILLDQVKTSQSAATLESPAAAPNAEDTRYKQIVNAAGKASPDEVANVVKMWLNEE
ncbi:MAG: flagellar basal-body MS-ring/collar protein FliF [Peptococcaceae bacterium]|nr:flagellar basal-body MS-ring/collar protein FliF [Peptococcaceae bacterium]